MSKPQTASEPSMEEILSSIRKMIADDRPGPSPIPDQMGRTPFGEGARSPAISEFSGRGGAASSPARPAAGQPTNFNSLADALKVATGLSDQRRSLQREIAEVLERGPQAEGFEPRQTSAAPTARKTPDAPSSDKNGARSPELPGWRDGLGGEPKRELMSFDFGTVVPQRTDAGAADKAANGAKTDKVDAKADGSSTEQPRIVSMPGRTGALNGAPSSSGLNGHGLNGAAATPSPGHPSAANGATIAPFPRTATTPADKPAVKADAATAASAAEVEAVLKANAAIDKTEALLDAVVDLVQQQPGALSVFTSGASFIGGVGKKAGMEPTPAAAASPAPAETADASPGLPAGLPPAPAKLDRAAAELLRPMLRQWLADNMPRIVEEALRSEMTDTVQGDEKSGDKD